MILISLLNLASRHWPPLPDALVGRFRRIRREFLPTEQERDADYLAAAGDLYDLEFRMRELNRPGRQGRGPFGRF